MTTLLERGRATPNGDSVSAVGLPSKRNVRRPALAVASVGLIFASIAAFSSLYSRASETSPVIVVTRPVAVGAVITPGDLGEADVSATQAVSPVPLSALSSIVGRRASVALVPGTLLTAADLSGANGIRKGKAVVGLSLRANQLPAGGVEAGDVVMVVQGASDDSGAGATLGAASSTGTIGSAAGPPAVGEPTIGTTLVPSAVVYGVASPPADSTDGAVLLVSIETTTALAPTLAAEAALGDVSLILLPGGGT